MRTMRASIVQLCLLLALSVSAFAAVPMTINVQGRLTDAGGSPIGEVEQRFDFKIFNAQAGGAEVWPNAGETGERHVLIPDAQGLWTTQIGTQYPINADHFVSKPGSPDSTRWLQITVDGTLLPRIHLTSAPFSVKVGSIDGALGGDVHGNITLHSQFKVGDEAGDAGRIKVTDGSQTTITADGTTGDLSILGKATLGFGNTNSGAFGFVAGDSNAVSGDNASIGGGNGNEATAPYASVAGGGKKNQAKGDYAVIGGGLSNLVDSSFGTIGGGYFCWVASSYGTVGGGGGNWAIGHGSTVGGGGSNTVDSSYGAICGGARNYVYDDFGAIGGGKDNNTHGEYSYIGGGRENTIDSNYASLGGGQSNHVSDIHGVIGGGFGNTAGKSAFVGGGNINEAIGGNSVISGGWDNEAAGAQSTVGGGTSNMASGTDATVPGGRSNWAEGARSLAAGAEAHAMHDGTVVISAKQAGVTDTIHSSAYGQMVLRAQGRFYLTNQGGTAVISSGDFLNTSTGAHLTTGGDWTNSSDANAKENFRPVDPSELLRLISQLSIREWNYKCESDSVRHIGPTAQDFHSIFGVGANDKSISTIDPAGIALVAIQELIRRNDDLAVRNHQLESQLAELRNLVDAITEGR